MHQTQLCLPHTIKATNHKTILWEKEKGETNKRKYSIVRKLGRAFPESGSMAAGLVAGSILCGSALLQ